MRVRAIRVGEYPSSVWRQPGDEFDYDGPTKISRPIRGKDGQLTGGAREEDYFPKWMEPLADEEPGAPDGPVSEAEQKNQLEVYAKDRFGVDLDKRKSLNKLKVEVAKLEQEDGDD